MNRCSKCNNELVADARFCNICGTPVPAGPATPETPAAPVALTGLKRTIKPDIRRVRPPREGRITTDLLASEASQAAAPVTPDTPDRQGESAGSDAAEAQSAMEQKQHTPLLSNPPIIPKTTIEFTSVKAGQTGEKQKLAPPDGTSKTTTQSEEGDDIATSPLPDLPASAPVTTPVGGSPAQVKTPPSSTATATSAPDKTVPLPPPNAEASRAPGIIRPIVTAASLRQNTPVPHRRRSSRDSKPLSSRFWLGRFQECRSGPQNRPACCNDSTHAPPI